MFNSNKRMHSKTTMDGGGGYSCKPRNSMGGGSGSYRSPRRPTITEKMHKADHVVASNRDGVDVWKSRYGQNGKVEMDALLAIVADMITRHKFDNSMDMFQETMKMKIIEVLKDVIEGENIIPKGDVEDANAIQRESGGNGSGRNSLLQRFISLC